MNKSLYAKTLVIAIAASFLVMAGNGLGNSGQSNETFEAANITKLLQDKSLSTVKISDKLDNAPNMVPPIEDPQSIDFQYGFEAETVGDIPADPPWLVTESNSTNYGNWGPYDFENNTVGQNPNDPPWTTADGTTVPTYWKQNFESYVPVPQPIDQNAFAGDQGYFYTVDPGATLVSATPPAGAPAGSIQAGMTTGAACLDFVDTAAAGSYFGPAGPGDATTAYAGGWFRLKANVRFDILLYDLTAGSLVAEVAFYPGQTGLVHWPGGTGTVLPAGTAWAINTWYELFVQYNEATLTYSVWFNGVQYGAGSAFASAATNVDGIICMADGTTGATSVYIDNLMHFVPVALGTQVVDVSNAWSYSGSGGTQSVYMDQNAYAAVAASATVEFPAPYAWSWAGISWVFRTSGTVANTNGAQFQVLDFTGRTLMAIRCSGGFIQYQNGAVWTNMMAFTANTEYTVDAYTDSTVKTYNIDIDWANVITGATMVNLGAGIGGFRAIATVSTQSEIYFDDVQRWGDLQPGTVRVSNARAHTGTQSVRMWEGGGDTACDMGAYMGGDLVRYGEFWFWFYGDGTLGGGQVYLMDTTQTYLVTIISLGGDLTANNIPHPGQMTWVDGDGAGGGFVVDGPTITQGTWYNVSIRYDLNAGTFQARLNGALQGTYGILESAAPDAGIALFFGEGPAAPVDFFFDDIGLWINDLPTTPQNLRTYFPPAMPSTTNYYTVDQDNAVQGTVTNTYTNADDLGTPDGLTENVREVLVAGAPANQLFNYAGVTVAGGPHNAWFSDPATNPPTQAQMSAAGTEFTQAQYTPLAASDDARNTMARVAAGTFRILKFEINGITITPATTTRIMLRNEVAYSVAGTVTNWAWNFTSGLWQTVGTTQAFTAGTEANMWRNITAGTSNFISGGTMRFLYTTTSDRAATPMDYVSATIFYTTAPTQSLEHRWRTQNVPAGADTLTLSVRANTSAAADDTFAFGYSTVLAGPYTPLITVNSATMTTYQAAMPILTGVLYINVVDSIDSDATLDTVYVDQIRMTWIDITGTTTANEIATAGTPVLGTVTGAYTLTNSIPGDASAQQIAEVAGVATTFINNEQFTSGVPPTGWTTQYDGIYGSWGPSATALAGGVAPEAMYTYGANGAGNGRLIAGPFDTTGFTALTLTFRHMLDTFAAGCTLRVQTSTDMTTWTNTGWSAASTATNIPATLVTEPLDATENVGSATLYVAFAVTLNSYNIDYWYVDAVNLVGTPSGYFATYRYTMQNIPANTIANRLTVTARISEATEPFNIGWSRTLAGPYTNVISVTATALTTYTATLPTNFDGSFYVQAKDTLSGAADTIITSVFIDSLYVASTIAPVNTTVNVKWDLSADDGGGQNDVTRYNVYYSDAATTGTSNGPFNYLGSVPAGSSVYRHYGEADDLVNNIWYIVTAQDAYSESFSTGRATKFNVAPVAQNVFVDGVSAVTVSAGTPVALTANVFDDSSTWEDILKIDGAEWYANVDPGAGLGTPMTGDGTFDTITEAFTASINTASMSGNNLIYVRGHEATPGNTGNGWGAVSLGVWVNITGALPPYTINLGGVSSGSWVFVSFPITVSGNVETILNDATLGDGLTTWDVAKWYNPQTPTDPWKTYRAGSTTNDLVTIDNTMGVWLHLTANGGDSLLTIAQSGSYSATSVLINLYTGWNLVGYPSATTQMGIATLPAQADAAAIFQLVSPYVMDMAPGAVQFTHGNAYWVHVTADCTWTVTP
jgi:hypothetical protein